ncbi:hypothetical protein EWB00_001290, partial [Schistosoma japonicum]
SGNFVLHVDYISILLLPAQQVYYYIQKIIKLDNFFALTLLPNSRIKLELELRPPQYRITRAHTTVTLNYSEKRKTNTHVNTVSSHLSHRFSSTPSSDWHTVEISFVSHGNYTIDAVKLKINEFHTQIKVFPPIDFSSLNSNFKSKYFLIGPYVFIGQLPDVMRADATERALFSAAMQPSFQGIIKDIYVFQCKNHSKKSCDTNFPSECTTYEPISFENGALKFIHNLIL